MLYVFNKYIAIAMPKFLNKKDLTDINRKSFFIAFHVFMIKFTI